MKKSILITCLYLCLILIAPIFSTHDPRQTDATNILQAPDTSHFFGTDNLGRDVYSRTLHGGQRTILLASAALAIAVIPALLLAMLNFISPAIVDKLVEIFLNAWLAFPSLLIALVILALSGRGFMPIAIATGLAQLPYFLQVARSTFKQSQSHEYITAAKSLGASDWHIVARHILPASRPTLMAYTGITFAYCIINSAALSLLGLGGDPSIPDWGVMLATGRTTFRVAPWTAFAPGIAISLTVILINKLADSLR